MPSPACGAPPPAAGLTTSVDPGSAAYLAGAGPAFLEWTAGVNLIFPNLAEGSILTGADDPDEVMRRLLVSFPIVALKLGERGAMVASRAEPVPVAGDASLGMPVGVRVVDPTGAGDAFCAGFLARWLGGADLAACRDSATAAAASRAGPGGRTAASSGRAHGGATMTGASRPPFDVVDVIRTKRDGHDLTGEQIRWFIQTYTAGGIAEEQCAALLMAIVWRGMTPEELSAWTAAMIATGERLDLSAVGRPTVDKHSTGGVGDKVSLPLVAMVAACGAAVPQLSGRGLGHTGGTLDKLESIPGWRARLGNDGADRRAEHRRGGVITRPQGQRPGADRRQALRPARRDRHGGAIPLIASSIMAKKIAEGTRALVLDVKTGSGAFMPDAGQARLLAETMVRLGEDNGVRTTALLTAMDTPLGRAAGNAIEVAEALDVLSGRGPEDLVTVTVALAREMLALAGVDADPDVTRTDGRALATWRAMVSAQGGDPDAGLPAAADHRAVRAPRPGYVTRLDARAVGTAVWRLGAGRARKEDAVSATAGIWCRAKPGEPVEAGQPVLELAVDDPARVDGALAALAGAFEIGPEPPAHAPLILDRITA